MSADKENNIKRSRSMRNSVGSSKQVLLNSDSANSSGLTNEFAGYLEYVRTLQDENDSLKSEKSNIIQSCEQEIFNIKETYGSEILALRKALDETTQEKCTTEYHNEKLLEENNNLKIKFARKIDAINELEKKYDEAEAALIKNRKCIEQYEVLRQENDDLVRSNILLGEQVKTEVAKRNEAETNALTLCDEIEFLRKVTSNNSSTIRDNSVCFNNKAETHYSEKFDYEMKVIRDELTDEFDQYKEQMEESYNQKLEELLAMNSKLNEKCTKFYNEKKTLQHENDAIHSITADLESQIAAISTREAKLTDIIAKMNKDHDEFISDILDENQDLKDKVQDMTAEITTLLNEKMANEKETYIFRSMLKGEQSRFNISDIKSPKRRRMETDDNSENEISAWSKDFVKIHYDSDNNNNCVVLTNCGTNDIDLNEWKINIETSCGRHVLFTIPQRVLKAVSSLKVWSLGQDIAEDESNMVMNVEIPVVEDMRCKLDNDMDETEATFELAKPVVKRKVLKANTKKTEANEKCCLM